MAISYDGGLTCSMGVSDVWRSLDWYQRVLGFELLYHQEDIAWCELSTGVARVNIGLSERRDVGGPGGATLTFGVTDIEAAKAALDAERVRQDGDIVEIPGLVRLLTFFDPDDNALMFYEEPKGGGSGGGRRSEAHVGAEEHAEYISGDHAGQEGEAVDEGHVALAHLRVGKAGFGLPAPPEQNGRIPERAEHH